MKLQRSHIFAFLCMLIPIVIALQGCGKDDKHPTSVPDGSIITVNPAATTMTIAATTSVDFSVSVKDKDGIPINKVPLRISGPFAEPRNATNTTARYQFYRFPGGENNTSNVKVDSGFIAETDSYGTYNFSITIYGTVGGVPNTFTDTIDVYSGTAFGSAQLTLN